MKTLKDLWTITVVVFIVYSLSKFVTLVCADQYVESLVWAAGIMMYLLSEILIVQSQIKLHIKRLSDVLIDLLQVMKS